MKKKALIIVTLLGVVGVLTACGVHKANQSIYKDILGKWQVASLRGEALSLEKGQMELSFDLREGRVFGYGFCNHFSGGFVLRESGNLSIGEIMSTRVGCEGNFMETALFEALKEVTRIEIKGNKAILYGDTFEESLMELKRL